MLKNSHGLCYYYFEPSFQSQVGHLESLCHASWQVSSGAGWGLVGCISVNLSVHFLNMLILVSSLTPPSVFRKVIFTVVVFKHFRFLFWIRRISTFVNLNEEYIPLSLNTVSMTAERRATELRVFCIFYSLADLTLLALGNPLLDNQLGCSHQLLALHRSTCCLHQHKQTECQHLDLKSYRCTKYKDCLPGIPWPAFQVF